MKIPNWIVKLFQTIDGCDIDGFLDFLTEDATFKFANADAVAGKKAIRNVLVGFFASIKGLKHTGIEVWVDPEAVICRGEVTYTRKNGTTLKVPFANIFKMAGELIKEYMIYVDISGL